MKTTKLPVWVWPALIVPALLSFFGIYKRHQVESRNKAVSIVAEFETIETLAGAQGLSTDGALQTLKERGLGGVILPEETVADLITQGRANIVSRYTANPTGEPGAAVASLQFLDEREIARVKRGLTIRFPDLSGNLAVRDKMLLLPPVDTQVLRQTPIGIDPYQSAIVRQANLIIIARHGNPTGASANSVRQTLSWSRELGASVFLPQGDQVLGRRENLAATVEALRSLDMLYASVEFAKIGGDSNVIKLAPDRVVRLHSAQAAELDKLTLADAVERYGKAARERNMRILLLRPISFSADKPLSSFGEFVGAVRDRIQSGGEVLGEPHTFKDTQIPRLYFLVLGLSIVPICVFAVMAFSEDRRVVGASVAGFLLLGVLCYAHIGQELMSLAASIVFPLAGFAILEVLRPRNLVLGFFLVTGISLIAGLSIVGMLNGIDYFIGADQPFGTKVGLFLPILLIGILAVVRLADLKGTLASPITWGSAAFSLAVTAVLALLVARSGNDTGASASDSELLFRNFLDRFLYVRPRTKEFLIGHPALVVGIGLLDTITRRPELRTKLGGWAALMLMLGAVGQTGAVNTLWHLHIPVVLSLARIAIGAVVGCMIGLGVWALVKRLLPAGAEA